mmetsp:Transcript_11166/g.18764  ORF Transcript_11166/g.18764 Transcript_11166/m.18764 type:complete len:127 (-) Transcript_11166:549-929(-)
MQEQTKSIFESPPDDQVITVQINQILGIAAAKVEEIRGEDEGKLSRVYVRVMVDDEDDEGQEDQVYTSVNPKAYGNDKDMASGERYKCGFAKVVAGRAASDEDGASEASFDALFNNPYIFIKLKNN